MTDFDPVLRQILRSGWTNQEARELLNLIMGRNPGSRVEWEDGDEEWGRVLSQDNDVIALVSARIPLCFLVASRSGHALFPPSVVALCVKDMAEPKFRASRALLEQVFERPLSDNLDYGNLSAEDIWWATV